MGSVILGTKGETILVDEDDYYKVKDFNWNCHSGYARTFKRKNKGRLTATSMHRLILPNEDKSRVVDHINGNKLDNRKCNLRICTPKQNLANTRPSKSNLYSNYKGVTWSLQLKKWKAVIVKDRKANYLGYFTDEIEAAKAYDVKAKELHKEFAHLNFRD